MSEDPLDRMMIEAGAAARRWYDYENPDVSIIVLNFNRSDLTRSCLLHLWRNTGGVRYEIILVDNGSAPQDVAELDATPGPFTLIKLPTNRYFGEGNNIGAERAKGRGIVFLNNDAFVSPAWLEPLLHCLDHAPDAGGVGPKFVYPGGRLQELGCSIDATGGVTRHLDDTFGSGAPRIVDYCSAACLLVSKTMFEAVGGFDFGFEPAYYEDADLSLKIKSAGKLIYCCPEACVVHIERATTSAHLQIAGRNALANNRQIFVDRWGGALAARSMPFAARQGPEPGPAAGRQRRPSRRRSGARIAFFLDQDLVPRDSVRLCLAAASAVAKRFDTILITPEPYSALRLKGLSEALSIDVTQLHLADLAQRHDFGPIDLAILASDGRAPAPALGQRRILLSTRAGPSPDLAQQLNATPEARIDACLTVSTFCQTAWRATLPPQLNVEICPTYPTLVAGHKGAAKADACSILMIGRFCVGDADKRQDVAIEAVRRLVALGHKIELHIAGWLQPEAAHRRKFIALQGLAENLPIHFHPNALGARLTQMLQTSTFYWQTTGFGVDPQTAPQRCEAFGAGLLDAMAASTIPIVVDSGGPLDILRNGETGYTYETLEDLVATTARLLADAPLRSKIAAGARTAVGGFTQARFDGFWQELVARHLGTREAGTDDAAAQTERPALALALG